jgi:hypothetical protein
VRIARALSARQEEAAVFYSQAEFVVLQLPAERRFAIRHVLMRFR